MEATTKVHIGRFTELHPPRVVKKFRRVDGTEKPYKVIVHELSCPTDCNADCELCEGAGSWEDTECDCVTCQALALREGLVVESECIPEAVALLAFWRRLDREAAERSELYREVRAAEVMA